MVLKSVTDRGFGEGEEEDMGRAAHLRDPLDPTPARPGRLRALQEPTLLLTSSTDAASRFDPCLVKILLSVRCVGVDRA